MKYITKEVSKDEVVLEIHGLLTGIESTDTFHHQLQELMASNIKIITLNFKDVESINSSCIGKIYLFQKKMEEDGRKIQIRGCSDNVHKTFQLIKLEQLINIER